MESRPAALGSFDGTSFFGVILVPFIIVCDRRNRDERRTRPSWLITVHGQEANETIRIRRCREFVNKPRGQVVALRSSISIPLRWSLYSLPRFGLVLREIGIELCGTSWFSYRNRGRRGITAHRNGLNFAMRSRGFSSRMFIPRMCTLLGLGSRSIGCGRPFYLRFRSTPLLCIPRSTRLVGFGGLVGICLSRRRTWASFGIGKSFAFGLELYRSPWSRALI